MEDGGKSSFAVSDQNIHRAEGDFRSLRRAILKPMTTVEQTNQTAAESPTR